jgi:hypothetical protein
MDQADGISGTLRRRKTSKLSRGEFCAELTLFICLRMETRGCSLSRRRSSVLMETLAVGVETESY